MRVGYSGICRDAELANQLDHAGPTVMGVARGSGGGGYAFLAKKTMGLFRFGAKVTSSFCLGFAPRKRIEA